MPRCCLRHCAARPPPNTCRSSKRPLARLPNKAVGLRCAWLASSAGAMRSRARARRRARRTISACWQMRKQILARIVAQVDVSLVRVAHKRWRLAARVAEVERARRGMTRLRALQRINAAANSTLDLDQTLTTTAQAVAQEMGADLCAIFLFDEVTRELQLRATNGPYPHNGRHFTLALGQGHTGWVAEHGHPLSVEDALADERFSVEASAYPTPFRGRAGGADYLLHSRKA